MGQSCTPHALLEAAARLQGPAEVPHPKSKSITEYMGADDAEICCWTKHHTEASSEVFHPPPLALWSPFDEVRGEVRPMPVPVVPHPALLQVAASMAARSAATGGASPAVPGAPESARSFTSESSCEYTYRGSARPPALVSRRPPEVPPLRITGMVTKVHLGADSGASTKCHSSGGASGASLPPSQGGGHILSADHPPVAAMMATSRRVPQDELQDKLASFDQAALWEDLDPLMFRSALRGEDSDAASGEELEATIPRGSHAAGLGGA